MKKILALFSVLLIITLIGCDDECVNCTACSGNEFRENFANTDCPAEELVIGCPNVVCKSIVADIDLNNPEFCEVIDCETLSCDNFRVDNGVSPQSGFAIEITVDEDTGSPIGFFDLEAARGEFTCGVVVQ